MILENIHDPIIILLVLDLSTSSNFRLSSLFTNGLIKPLKFDFTKSPGKYNNTIIIKKKISQKILQPNAAVFMNKIKIKKSTINTPSYYPIYG